MPLKGGHSFNQGSQLPHNSQKKQVDNDCGVSSVLFVYSAFVPFSLFYSALEDSRTRAETEALNPAPRRSKRRGLPSAFAGANDVGG